MNAELLTIFLENVSRTVNSDETLEAIERINQKFIREIVLYTISNSDIRTMNALRGVYENEYDKMVEGLMKKAEPLIPRIGFQKPADYYQEEDID